MINEDKKLERANRVEVSSDAHLEYMEKTELVRTLLGGTDAMREAGTAFLPKEKKETDDAYARRKERSFLFEAYKRTIQKLAGEVFSKPAVLHDVRSDIAEWCEYNVDQQGRDLTRFAQLVFYYALAEGVCFILVDYPEVKTTTTEEGRVLYYETYEDLPEDQRKQAEWLPLTKAVDKKKGWRPYFVLVRGKDVIGYRTKQVNGKVMLAQVRIMETAEEAIGNYGNETIERIRVLEPGKFTLWRKVLDTTERKYKWVVEKEGTTSLDFIPLHTFMPGETLSFMTAAPPLQGLAELNLAHWQSSSDQRNILHYARLITYFGKMLMQDEDEEVIVGHNQVIMSDSPEGDFKIVEHSGKGIEAGRQDLLDLERQMAMFGLTYMMPRTGTMLATERAITKSENDSALMGWALQFEDFLDSCLVTTFKYVSGTDADIKDSGYVKVNTDFSNWLKDMHGQLLISAFENGAIPRRVVFEEFQRRGIVSDEYEFEDLLGMMEEDRRKGMVGAGGIAGGFLDQLGREEEEEEEEEEE